MGEREQRSNDKSGTGRASRGSLISIATVISSAYRQDHDIDANVICVLRLRDVREEVS